MIDATPEEEACTLCHLVVGVTSAGHVTCSKKIGAGSLLPENVIDMTTVCGFRSFIDVVLRTYYFTITHVVLCLCVDYEIHKISGIVFYFRDFGFTCIIMKFYQKYIMIFYQFLVSTFHIVVRGGNYIAFCFLSSEIKT